ncbi:MAG: CYTH domain-containing protein [Oscillospiraceae bacterium]|nr:CYTH domain-containing protein [Oscillospiraceae bacterium]
MEIERKWLVEPGAIPYDLSTLTALEIEQAYVSFSPVVRIRKINRGEKHILTVKKLTTYGGLAAGESEHEIDGELYAFLLKQASGNVIAKTRYLHPLPSGLTEEIDVFSGQLKGLAYLEIEFPDVEQAKQYPSPDWVKADVTYDRRYKNSALALEGIPEGAF